MALKPTIYKAHVELADSDRGCFESLSLTLAQHPSETLERMTVRLLVYCLHAAPQLEFTRGLSSSDEPDLWRHAASGELEHWIEVGQPEPDRLRKACGRAPRISVYAFGASADTWWSGNADAIGALPRAEIWQFSWDDIQAATQLVERTVNLAVSIVGGVLYLDNAGRSCALEPRCLQRSG